MCGPVKHFLTLPAQTLIENCCWCLGQIVLYGFMALQMCVLWKFSVLFFVKPASSVKSVRLLKNGSSQNYERNHWQNYWCELKSSECRACTQCKWYRYSNCSWRICRTHWQGWVLEWQSQSLWIFWSNVCLLLLDKCWNGESALHISVCPVPHQLFVHYSVFHGLP
jgi:hypothetical protein